MNTQTDLHAVDWKSGTEALALCMICGGEYPTETQECPDCKVSLSIVRRCPHCLKIVSAKHKKCVYCHTQFTLELPQRLLPEELPLPDNRGLGPAARRFHAALVSVSTFVIVVTLGMWFLGRMNEPAFSLQGIAHAKLVGTAELRRSPSSSSSNLGQLTAGTAVTLTGFMQNDDGRWMSVQWRKSIAYLPASAVSAPVAIEANDGADVLRFYLAGMDAANAGADAVHAVDAYAKSFPGNAHADELRLSLAERLKSLSQRGGSQAADLRRLAAQQFELVASSNGRLAAKAREALANDSEPEKPETTARKAHAKKKDRIEIIGGSGTQVSAPQPARRVVLTSKAAGGGLKAQ